MFDTLKCFDSTVRGCTICKFFLFAIMLVLFWLILLILPILSYYWLIIAMYETISSFVFWVKRERQQQLADVKYAKIIPSMFQRAYFYEIAITFTFQTGDLMRSLNSTISMSHSWRNQMRSRRTHDVMLVVMTSPITLWRNDDYDST